MCYSAQIRHDYNKFLRVYGAVIDIKEFVRLYWNRQQGAKTKIPKAMDAAFAQPQTDDERTIAALAAAVGAVIALARGGDQQRCSRSSRNCCGRTGRC